MVSQFDKNRKTAFARKLRGLMEGWEKSHGKKLTQGDLAAAVFVSRESLNGWLQGKTFPVDSAISGLCTFFGVPPTYFAPDEEELIYTDEERHKELDARCRKIADRIGLSESLLQFCKERPDLADLLISASWVNPVINPPDSKIPDSDSVYQFVSSSGVRVYLPKDVLYMLRCVQRDLEEYSSFLIRKYSQTISEYYQRQDEDSLPPARKYALDLEGMPSLSADESLLIDAFRKMDSKNREEFIKSAAVKYSASRKGGRK
jgi:transcriptional regulator with XRE-family HTH domain